ncbi:aminotransferase class I/II-fold pyridoxal phosphate-dependent enzyme [Herbinix luporum]|uniref:aminotransferase class I/II-fold pyridoxal phosphate-dependent enzyme n=1 Tax=Herbinix luporum TaxID=1679721 RepID=UPI0023F28036|nr:aminotransferase class I/II-fold pyridoxal phosphate-dependent enzyme [Herbinix luporum]
MQALILAAGMGKRLKELTRDSAKCMVKVNQKTLIERMLYQLDRLKLREIVIVVGYKADRLISYINSLDIQTPITFVTNDIYYKTNNIYSLYLARDYLLKDDTLLLESDLIFSDTLLKKILNNTYPNLALVARYESWMDGTVVTIDSQNNITRFIDKKEFDYRNINQYYKTVNIYKFSKEFSKLYYVPFLKAYIDSKGINDYYEQVLKVLGVIEKSSIKAEVLKDEAWYEIDDVQDLDIAETIFSQDSFIKIRNRYGGYWRYPKLIDFCYLVNPFYPPEKMIEEIKANIGILIGNYPSGIEVNSLVAGKYYGIKKEHICPGNGAAELISSLMKTIDGSIGIIYPTFDEYPNRLDEKLIVPYYPKNRNFSYGSQDLMDYYEDTNIKALLLINPDNPSGNFMERSEVIRLAAWAQEKGIRLIVDESFVDFANADDVQSLLSEVVLQKYKNLAVVKSISKSFGVPGLRLGVIGSADEELIRFIKKDIAIWNINSIAEFYLQICEKYKNEYNLALEKFKLVRSKFLEDLKNIPNLRVIPSQANFVMCEVLGGYFSAKLSETLLYNHKILIKDLSAKKGVKGQYIRVAVKTSEENNLLIAALYKTLGLTSRSKSYNLNFKLQEAL